MFERKIIDIFCFLGKSLKDFKDDKSPYRKKILNAIKLSKKANGWFDEAHICFALESLAGILQNQKIENWLAKYNINNNAPKTIGVIMAGNIPLVGFHDFLCVLCSGHCFKGKLSSNDQYLLPLLAEIMIQYYPDLKDKIHFVNNHLDNFDAVIATGSNNTAHYFKSYFTKYPHIIRMNRSSVAILSGYESQEELDLLSEDVFKYYGLGCRNVSKLYLPSGFDLDRLFKSFYSYKNLVHHPKYANNYTYNKAVYLMGNKKIIENGFLLLKEDKAISSPISVLHYQYYNDLKEVENDLLENDKDIQCIVSHIKDIKNKVDFGHAQLPLIDDYADGVDTMRFLTTLN